MKGKLDEIVARKFYIKNYSDTFFEVDFYSTSNFKFQPLFFLSG